VTTKQLRVVPLSLQSRSIGDNALVACAGRFIEGSDATRWTVIDPEKCAGGAGSMEIGPTSMRYVPEASNVPSARMFGRGNWPCPYPTARLETVSLTERQAPSPVHLPVARSPFSGPVGPRLQASFTDQWRDATMAARRQGDVLRCRQQHTDERGSRRARPGVRGSISAAMFEVRPKGATIPGYTGFDYDVRPMANASSSTRLRRDRRCQRRSMLSSIGKPRFASRYRGSYRAPWLLSRASIRGSPKISPSGVCPALFLL
jgi:hypothetical protein